MKILVTGSNGLLGQKLIHLLAKDPTVELVATSRGENRTKLKEEYIYESLDITNKDQVFEVLYGHEPDAVINTAGMTNVDACEDDKEGCDALNVSAVEYLVDVCEQIDAHLIHVSTDFIFDGTSGPYREDDDPNPVNYYGESKLKGEHIVVNAKCPWSILRTVLVYGVADDMSRSNIVLWAKGALEKGAPLNIVNDQFRTPTLAEDLAMGCFLCAKKAVQGVFHISGDDFMSIYELVDRVGKFYGLDTGVVSPVTSTGLNQRAPRPPKTGFYIDKARSLLGYQPHSFEQGLALVQEQLS